MGRQEHRLLEESAFSEMLGNSFLIANYQSDKKGTSECDLSFSIVFCSSLNANTSWWAHEGSRQRSGADNTDQGEKCRGVHAVLYPPTIAALKREEGWGGFGIKDGIKQAG
jgi:hypothetical protein